MKYLGIADTATLRTELAKGVYAAMSDQERSDYLHRPEGTIANPIPQPQVPIVMDVTSLLSLLTDANNHSIAKLAACPSAPSLRDDVLAQDLPRVKSWAEFFVGAGIITVGEYQSVNTYLNSIMLDPTWSSTIPAPSPCFRLFGGKTWKAPDGSSVNFVTIEDIASARS